MCFVPTSFLCSMCSVHSDSVSTCVILYFVVNRQSYLLNNYRAFVVAFQAIAYEFGVEMTFPVPEGVSVSVLNAFSQVHT